MANPTKSPAKAPKEQKPNEKAGEAPTKESAATTEKPEAAPEAPETETPEAPEPEEETSAEKAKKAVKTAKAKKPTRKCFACQRKVGDIYMVMSELRMRLCLDCGMEALDEVAANADNPDYD